MRIKSTSKGFTLIELMVVIVVVALLVGLVAPLTFKQLNTSRAKTEYLTLRNTLKKHTTKAFAQGIRYQMQMKGNTLTAHSILGVKSFVYENLVLPEMTFVINRNGYPSLDKFELQVANQTRSITLEDMLGVKQDLIYAKIQ
jgi:prepilin-type N-terminal cleavage/methylation domain-containing protein